MQYIQLLKKLVTAAANIFLCVMVVVTCIDVIGRYFFSAPLLGAHEIVTLAMGMMIYLGMPIVTAAQEHLVVDLAGSVLNRKGKRIQKIIVNITAALTFALFSYLLVFHGFGLAEDLMATEDLEVEQAPIAYVMAVMCFFTIFIFLYQILQDKEGKGTSHLTSNKSKS